MVKFKLYIIGESHKSNKLINELKKFLALKLDKNYQLETIDLLKNYQEASEDNILCTPTLIKLEPDPVRKVVGDLSDMEKVFQILMSLELNF